MDRDCVITRYLQVSDEIWRSYSPYQFYILISSPLYSSNVNHGPIFQATERCPIERYIGVKTGLRLYCRDQLFSAQDIDDSLHIVGKHMQTHLRTDVS